MSSLVRSFNDCEFSITLPQLNILEDCAEIKFDYRGKSDLIETHLMKWKIIDRVNIHFESTDCGIVFPAKTRVKKVCVKLPRNEKKLFKRGSILYLYFGSSQGVCTLLIYRYDKEDEIIFEGIERTEMDLADYEVYQKAVVQEVGQKNENGTEREKNNKISNPVDNSNAENMCEEFVSPKLEQYIKAVYTEMYYLKNEGGREYRVINGKQLNYKNGIYSYDFEMESEIFLAEDSPIRIVSNGIGSTEAEGNVLICEDFHIVILIDKDLGKEVASARIVVEPWKLLEALSNRLKKISSTNNRIATKLIEEGPSLATKQSISSIPMGQGVAMKTCKNSDITVVWGPPGTGKSYVMANVAVDMMQKNKRVLIVSHSNVSVDSVIKEVLRTLERNRLAYLLGEGKVLRYGYVRDEYLSKENEATSFNYTINKCFDMQLELETLIEKKKQLKQDNRIYSAEGVEVQKSINKLKGKIHAEEKRYVGAANILGTTISKVSIDKIFDDLKYDVVMFDEASMAYVPQIIEAAMFATSHFVCVGDFKQLPPISQSVAKKELNKDIFSFLRIVNNAGEMFYHPWLVMLNIQRRMHPDIAKFSNKYVYKGLLTSHDSMQENRLEMVNREPFAGNAMNFIDLSGTYCVAGKTIDNSHFNILSAMISFLSALHAERNGSKTVGIISPYAAQVRLIRSIIEDYRASRKHTNIVCSTVHQFQGSECETIIFDAVESYPFAQAGYLLSKNENESVTRLINVAVTRAKGKFIAVGNNLFWKNKFPQTPIINLVRLLFAYMETNGNVISHKEKRLDEYISNIQGSRRFAIYIEKDKFISQLEKDIDSAVNRILISIPDGEVDNVFLDKIYKLILSAWHRGVKILCKANAYDKLPNKWKEITWKADNAIFPLLVVDDSVTWYGLPQLNGKVIEGTLSFKTVLPIAFRIEGTHTAEMITGFAELETRKIDKTITQLTPRSASKYEIEKGDDGTGAEGIVEYINKNIYCNKCGKGYRFVRSRKGVAYLKCSDSKCDGQEYLTPELVNKYITEKRINCPEDGGNIEARLGSKGVYIRCSNGHFMSPDRI